MRHTGPRFLAAALVALVLSGCVVVDTAVDPPERQRPDADASASADGYAFLYTRDNGRPVRWSSCEPIRYVVRPDNEPEGSRPLLEESFDRVAEASGLEFSFEGETDEGPADERPVYDPERYGEVWSPVLVVWSDEGEYPRLEGRAAGYGGPTYVQQSGAPPRYVSGMVVLDAEQIADMGGDEAARAVMVHEIAHVVGLGHVEDRAQLMNPVQYGRQVTELQAGDLAGLEILGAGRCLDPLEPQTLREQ